MIDIYDKDASKLDDDQLIERITSDFVESRDSSRKWRKETSENYALVAGHQWDDNTVAMMDPRQPPVVFNRAEIFCLAVTGLEALNKREVKYIPRKASGDYKAMTDLWSDAADYVNSDGMADMHHSHAFRDLVICGLGVTHTRPDFESNPDGDIKQERKHPLNFFWDPRATGFNLSDRRWNGLVDSKTYREIRAKWPDKAEALRHANRFNPQSEWRPEPYDGDKRNAYSGFGMGDDIPGSNDVVYLMVYQWYEQIPFIRAQLISPDGAPGEIVESTIEDWKAFAVEEPEKAILYDTARITKRCYYQAVVAGDIVLERTKITSNDFSIQVMTGKYDEKTHQWYGLVRNLRDPQRLINKLYSQMMFIISTNAKGGLLAEEGAFINQQDAEEKWSDPSGIVMVEEGAISGQKIMPRPVAEYPASLERLMQIADNMFQQVTGANIELLGLSEKVQPGVLEAQRKQAGMTILSWAFDSLNAYKRTQGKVLAEYIIRYIADGRLIRVSKEDGAERYIPLMRDDLALELDVIVDDAPTSANERERTFAILQQILPMLIQAGADPSVIAESIRYMPLPGALINKIQEIMTQGQDTSQLDQQKAQLEQMAQQLSLQKAQLENLELSSKAELNKAKALEAQAKAMS